MEKKLTYEKVIERIKNTSPALEKQEELTQRILVEVRHLSVNRMKIKMYKLTAVVSGMAASLLFCVLAKEITRPVELDTSQPVTACFSPETHRLEQIFTKEHKESVTSYSASEKVKIVSLFIKERWEDKSKREYIYNAFASEINKSKTFK
ncbi:MAG: hypothetical protein LBN11_04440 [Tannerella sp.]|jgi:hypothetical protein|nr:hypothetical protein [Tannerella sp.]